jgi:manganese/zinc/iron transport system substrate-binding protein
MSFSRTVIAVTFAICLSGCSHSDSNSYDEYSKAHGDYPDTIAIAAVKRNAPLASEAPISGCSDPKTKLKLFLVGRVYRGDGPLRAVCTTGVVADLVRNVGGPHVHVTQLMAPDVDPHSYVASSGDISVLNRAGIIFYSGLNLESKLSDLLARLAMKKPVCAVSQYIPAKDLLRDPDGQFDPHVWFDTELWKHGIDVVRDALSAYDPEHSDDYHARADAYAAKLDATNDELLKVLATVPENRRVLVAAHDAFRYFGRANKFETYGIQSDSTEFGAGVSDIDRLVGLVCRREVPAVFPEATVASRNIQSLVEGCQSKRSSVAIGGELCSDTTGEPITTGVPVPEKPSEIEADRSSDTYLGMLRYDAETIAGALK